MSRLRGRRIAIVGGCGHVGLPLGVKLALAGADTCLVDIDEKAVADVTAGRFPFRERNGDRELERALRGGLRATTDPDACRTAEVLIFVTGTPVDEHLNPRLSEVLRIFDLYDEYFTPPKLVILRSTLFPRTMDHLRERFRRRHHGVQLAFCPERISQGRAFEEIDVLPQIVAAFDDESFQGAFDVFAAIAPKIIRLVPLEAELAKLMANSWRYLEFAIANQFYRIAEAQGADFHRILKAIKLDYPRADGYKTPGFAAGPCLFKDTMQLASYHEHDGFTLGHAAMLVNEGLAGFVVDRVKQRLGADLYGRTVGLLGMTFKPNCDDTRESLSFKVKKLLEFAGARVLCADPHLSVCESLERVLSESDALVLCTPHDEYRRLETRLPLVDVWGILHDPPLEVWTTGASSAS